MAASPIAPDAAPADREYGALLDPAAFPALMTLPRYAAFLANGECGELLHLHEAIEHDDLPAVREFARLRPRLLALEDPSLRLSPPLVAAVQHGNPAVLALLLDHRDALPPALHVDAGHDADADPDAVADPDERGRWGSPLTTACARARLDLAELLLARMPDGDDNADAVNAHDNMGYTPLLAVAARSGVDAVYGAGTRDQSADRVRLLRLLLDRGADPHATQQLFLSGGDDREMRRMALLATGATPDPVPLVVDIPGGGGNALVLAMARPVSDPAVIAALVDAGVDIHQGYLGGPARFDRSRARDEEDEEEEEEEEEEDDDDDDQSQDQGTQDETEDAEDINGYVEVDYDYDDDDDDDDGYDGYDGYVEEDIYMTPLAAGALYHNTTGIEALLQHGAAPDLTATAIDPVLFPGHALLPLHTMLPLHAAVAGRPFHPLEPAGALATIALLTADAAVCAATINATCRGYTPLALATQSYQSFQCLPVVRALLDRGADPGLRPPAGPGPLLALFASLPRWHRALECSMPSVDETDEPADDDAEPPAAPWVAAEEAVDMEALLRDLLPHGTGPDADARRLAAVNEATETTGNTALHLAVRYGLRRSEAALLRLGARADICNRAGHVASAMPRR